MLRTYCVPPRFVKNGETSHCVLLFDLDSLTFSFDPTARCSINRQRATTNYLGYTPVRATFFNLSPIAMKLTSLEPLTRRSTTTYISHPNFCGIWSLHLLYNPSFGVRPPRISTCLPRPPAFVQTRNGKKRNNITSSIPTPTKCPSLLYLLPIYNPVPRHQLLLRTSEASPSHSPKTM
jgi:hypothetical protein